jgi:hypothetical protein
MQRGRKELMQGKRRKWVHPRKLKTLEEIDGGLNASLAFKASLVGADLERADLSDKDLRGANFTNANLRGACLCGADLKKACFIDADLSRTCCNNTDFSEADISGSDFTGAYLKGAIFHNTIAQAVLFRRVSAKNALFINTDLRKSDFFQSELLGARFDGANTYRVRNTETCQFVWWLSPWGGMHSYEPRPGWTPIDGSTMGNISIRENSARERLEDDE